MTHPSDSLLHPIHGVAAEDIAAELGHSTGARIGALERMVDRILRYLVLRIRAFRGIQILTGPDAGALVTPDGNGVIGIECQSETGTIQAVEELRTGCRSARRLVVAGEAALAPTH